MLHVDDFVVATRLDYRHQMLTLWKEHSLHTRIMRSIGRLTGVVVVASGAGGLVNAELFRYAAFLFPFSMNATLVDVVNIAFSHESPKAIARRSKDERYSRAV